MKMDVDGFVERYNGEAALLEAMREAGVAMRRKTVAVWRHRESIPAHVLVALMLQDPTLDPRQYGWEPK